MRKKIISLLLTLAMLAPLSTVSATGNSKDVKANGANTPETDGAVFFDDVAEGDSAYEAVVYVSENGLMNGVGGGKFAPESVMNRAIILTALWRMAGSPEVGGDPVFTDVPEDAWYTTAVRWAMSKEIVKGLGNKIFAPLNNVTREQAAIMMFRHAAAEGMTAITLEENLGHFKDVDQLAEYAVSAMNWAVGRGIITERDGGALDPKGTVTRGELAGMVMRFDQFLKEMKKAAAEMEEEAVSNPA